jgi:hypothetical protein
VAINRATLRAERELQAFLNTILDAQARSLVEAWVVAWDQTAAVLDAAVTDLVQAAQGGRVTRTMVIRSQRAQQAMDALGRSLDGLAATTGTVVTRDLRQALEVAAGLEHDMIASQLTGTLRAGLAVNLVRADPGQITAMVQRATQQITAVTRPLGAEAYAQVRRELLRGISVGANPRTAARRMVRDVEDRFNGGLTRAMTISRTEMLDATRAAAMQVDKANTDVVAGWTWVAHLDPDTCRSCVANHGSVHDIDEPGPLDHQNGRCSRVPKTKTWAELGFQGIEDPPDLLPDAEAWFTGLSADQQRAMLGDNGYQAWKAGDYPREKWTTKRETDGWRDSMVPSRPPAVAA